MFIVVESIFLDTNISFFYMALSKEEHFTIIFKNVGTCFKKSINFFAIFI